MPWPNCFGLGTPIATPAGEVPIERIAIGDRVLAFDFATEAVVGALVVDTMRHEGASLLRLPLPYGAALVVTAEHPIYSVSAGVFEPAGTLDGNVTLLALTSLESALATRVEIDLASEPNPATVYNLTVDTFHNYFAGGVLVHNKSRCWPEENGCWRCVGGGGWCSPPDTEGSPPAGAVVDAAADAAEGGASGADGSGGAGGHAGGAGGEGGI